MHPSTALAATTPRRRHASGRRLDRDGRLDRCRDRRAERPLLIVALVTGVAGAAALLGGLVPP